MSKPTLRVSEIFGPTIQGEGTLIGMPTLFVRTGGCDYRCSWCDTPHAVLSVYRSRWKEMTPGEVLAELHKRQAPPFLVTLSGGNPAIQGGLSQLLDLGHADGYTFAMETQGSVPRAWFSKLDHLVLSPKPPSSGMATDLGILRACAAAAPSSLTVKVVVFDAVDFAFAGTMFNAVPQAERVVQVGNRDWSPEVVPSASALLVEMERLWGMVLDAAAWDPTWRTVRVLPQLHTMLWGNRVGV